MPSYLSYLKHIQDAQQDDNIESWITVRGNHIPIMKGQSKAEAVIAFIDKKENEKNDGLIRPSNANFGKAGKYKVFRSGDLSAPNGTIFTSADIEHARQYADTEESDIDEYNVEIKNPLVIEGESDVAILKNSYKRLFGRDFGDKILDAITWPKYDAMIAKRLANTKYDALITIENGRGKEIQLPKGTLLEKVGSYKRKDLDWDTNAIEYQDAMKVEEQLRSAYSDFVNNPPLNEKTVEEIKTQAEEMRQNGLASAKYIKALRKFMVYETYNKLNGKKD